MPLAMWRCDFLLGSTTILKWMEDPKEQLRKGLNRGQEGERGQRALDLAMDTGGELIPSWAFE